MDCRKDPIHMPQNKKFCFDGLDLCPFCRGYAKVEHGSDSSSVAVRCTVCGVRTRSIQMPYVAEGGWQDMWWKMRDEAAKLWNRRA